MLKVSDHRLNAKVFERRSRFIVNRLFTLISVFILHPDNQSFALLVRCEKVDKDSCQISDSYSFFLSRLLRRDFIDSIRLEGVFRSTTLLARNRVRFRVSSRIPGSPLSFRLSVTRSGT